MTGCDRMMAAIRGEQPDKVPIWELIINRPVIQALHPELFTPEKVARHEWGSSGGFLLQADFIEKEDLDGITIFEDVGIKEEIDEITYRDEWDITWRLNDQGIPYAVDHPIRAYADLDSYRAPDPDSDERLKTLHAAVRRFKGEKAIVFLTHDAFEFSHYLRGMSQLLMDYVTEPGFVHRLAQVVMEYKKRILERAVEMGADILCTGDDYAHRGATIMSPDHFRKFILPYLREAVQIARNRGIPFLKHTDGNLWQVLDDIVGTGIDCLDPLEPLAGMDIGKMKKLYGHRIALAGNVDCSVLLPFGSTLEVNEAVKETIAKAAVGGGYILASSNSIHPGVKPDNYRAMVEAGRRFGSYPLDELMISEYSTKDYLKRYRDRIRDVNR